MNYDPNTIPSNADIAAMRAQAPDFDAWVAAELADLDTPKRLPRASVVPDASRQHACTSVGDACAGEISRPLGAGSGEGSASSSVAGAFGVQASVSDTAPAPSGRSSRRAWSASAFRFRFPMSRHFPPLTQVDGGTPRTSATTVASTIRGLGRQPSFGVDACEGRSRARLLLAAAALGLGLTIPPTSAAAASLPVCHVYEDGSGLCTFGGGTQKAYGNDPKTDAPCFISKQKATTGRPAISDATGYWPNRDLRLYLTRGSEPYLCIVVTS